MSNLYKQYRTDPNVEREGILLELGENSKGQMMAIRIARAGGANTAYNKLVEARIKPYRRQIQNDTMDSSIAERVLAEVYAETVVIGWENLEDEKNNPLPYSVDNCKKLFADLPDLFKEIQLQSQRTALYRADILEADAKN